MSKIKKIKKEFENPALILMLISFAILTIPIFIAYIKW